MADAALYAGLFLAAFTAATLIPAQSELVLASLILGGEQPVWALVLTASAGNTLGSTVNWLLGSYFYHLRNRKWFPIKAEALEKAGRRYARYGRWSLLLSWAPIIGDPLTLVAGIMKEPLKSFLAIVACAKTCRYLAVAWLTLKQAA